MEKHAFAILTKAESWDWPPSYRIQNQGGKYNAMTAKLLHGFIAESQQLGGTQWGSVTPCLGKMVYLTSRLG